MKQERTAQTIPTRMPTPRALTIKVNSKGSAIAMPECAQASLSLPACVAAAGRLGSTGCTHRWACMRDGASALLGEDEMIEYSPVGAGDIVRREGRRQRSVGQDCPVDQRHLVAERGERGEVVRADDDRVAFVAQLAQQGDDRFLGLGVDPGERLVEQHDPRVLRQRPGQERALPLPARKFADLPVAEVGHPDALRLSVTFLRSIARGVRRMFIKP